MNLINNLFYIGMLTSLTGSAAFLIWKGIAFWLNHSAYYRSIYYLLVAVIPFWLCPFMYIYMWGRRYAYMGDGNWAVTGNSFLMTPTIQRFEQVLAVVWLIGAAAVLVWHIFGYGRVLMRVHRNSIPLDEGIVEEVRSAMHLKKSVRLCQCYGLESPFVSGVLHPVITLPVKSYTYSELEAILYHELTHVRQKVLLYKCVGVVIENIFWFNPISYWLNRELDYWAEVSCDIEACFYRKGSYSPRDYFLAALGNSEEAPKPQFTMFGKRNYLKERICKVKNYKHKRELSKIVVAGLIGVMCLGSASVAYAAGISVESGSEKAYEETVEEVNITGLDYEELEIFVEDYDESAQNVIVADVFDMARGLYPVNWPIPTSTLMRTPWFSLEKGDAVSFLIVLTPANKSAKVGILSENGRKTYVIGSGTINRTITADQNGRYAFFIENTNSDAALMAEGSVAY